MTQDGQRRRVVVRKKSGGTLYRPAHEYCVVNEVGETEACFDRRAEVKHIVVPFPLPGLSAVWWTSRDKIEVVEGRQALYHEAVFRRMVAKNPSDRYQSVTALIEDLQQLQQGEKPARHPKPAAPKKDAAPRRVSLFTFLLIILLTGILGSSAIVYYDNYMPGEGTIELDVNERDATVMVIDRPGGSAPIDSYKFHH